MSEVLTYLSSLSNKITSRKNIIKKWRIKTLEKDFHNWKKHWETLGIIDYTVSCLFLTQNNRKLAPQQNTHYMKLFNLGLDVSKVSHDLDKIMFNYSSLNLSKSEIFL